MLHCIHEVIKGEQSKECQSEVTVEYFVFVHLPTTRFISTSFKRNFFFIEKQDNEDLNVTLKIYFFFIVYLKEKGIIF